MANPSTTYDDILRCARTLIVAGGYNGFSYADIAEVVGVRKASIHHHFPTKADLVRALVVLYRAEADAGMAALERNHPDPVDQLSTYTGYWEQCLGDATSTFCVCALLATEIPLLPPEITTEVTAYFRALSSWLASALKRGKRAGTLALAGSAHAEAELFMATIHGAMLSARAYGDTSVFREITQPLIKRLVATKDR